MFWMFVEVGQLSPLMSPTKIKKRVRDCIATRELPRYCLTCLNSFDSKSKLHLHLKKQKHCFPKGKRMELKARVKDRDATTTTGLLQYLVDAIVLAQLEPFHYKPAVIDMKLLSLVKEFSALKMLTT